MERVATGISAGAEVGRRSLAIAVALSLGLVIWLSADLKAHDGNPAEGSYNGTVAHARLYGLPLGETSAAIGRDIPAYRVRAVAAGFHATNRAQHFSATFARGGVLVRSGKRLIDLSVRAVGYGSSLRALGSVRPHASANRVSYDRPDVSEWYVNGPFGLEQGFTIPAAFSGADARLLTISMSITGDGRAALAPGGRSIRIGRAGEPSLDYTGLRAFDADGRPLRARLALRDGRILLRVDTHGARYPVRIDPFLQQGEKLTSAKGGGFGSSVAVSGDGNTALVGDPGANAALIFIRSGATWTQQGTALVPSDQSGSSEFGSSVSLSADGNTAVIGGPHDRREGKLAGAAWIFTRTGTTWSQQGSKLTGGDESEGPDGGEFGSSVSISKDASTVLVGGPYDTSGIGAAWVFAQAEGTWAQQGPKLTATPSSGTFGWSVALSTTGDTALIGGPYDESKGSAWVFTRSGSSWSQQGARINAVGQREFGWFGAGVALSGDGNTALIGNPKDQLSGEGGKGAAWVFARSGSAWQQQGSKLTSTEAGQETEFGASVALSSDGSEALIGGPGDVAKRGAVWVFARSGSLWTQQRGKLTSGANEGAFGTSVALSGDSYTGLIGAPLDSGELGAAWVFVSQPTVTNVSPAKGPPGGGTSVTITGTNFSGATAVKFGSRSAMSFSVNSPTSITAVSPPWVSGNAIAEVTVTTPAGTTPTSIGDSFTYEPAVTKIAPKAGPVGGGTSVKVTGDAFEGRFENGAGEMPPFLSGVKFGASNAAGFAVSAGTSITAISPAEEAGTVNLSVATLGGTSPTSTADRFKFFPTISNVAPNTGPHAGGTSVTVTGTGFVPGATTIKFGSTLATSVQCTSWNANEPKVETTCTAVSSAHATGTVDVRATVNKVTSPKKPGDRFTYS